MNAQLYRDYVAILQEDLVPALGCTEPIAIAFAAAKAREVLGSFPEHIAVACSGNIIKNVKGVTVPTTGNMKGVETSAILGAVGGVADKKLEVLSEIQPEHIERTRQLLTQDMCDVALLEGVSGLDIIVTMTAGGHRALVELLDGHTHIVRIEKDDETLYSSAQHVGTAPEASTDYTLLNLQDIYEFANTVAIEDVRAILDRQIDYNMAIAQEGLEQPYGANVGSTLLKYYGDDIKIRARAYPAAGSDARMSGCVLPVVTNSGSGNQGITVCVPVVLYADALGVSEDVKYRALVLSNLIAIYQKVGLGKLSAYCGAVSAACGSGAAITYLTGGDFDAISRTITNTLGNISGMVCDGAKSSCAAKIASAMDAAILGHLMSLDKQAFGAGEGLVMDNVEATIHSVGRMGRVGMHETDVEILNIMIGK